MPKLMCILRLSMTVITVLLSVPDHCLYAQGAAVQATPNGRGALPTATLAIDGKPQMTIVLAKDAIPSERTAAEELAGYLGKITGGTFAVVEESAAVSGPCLYVGPTAFARKQALDPSAWGPERWALRSVGADLVLVGGRPRGTLYAVYHFLEDELGVRWWNTLEENVPQQPTLQVSALDRQGEPKFRYRDIYLLYAFDGGRFGVRNRLNGQGFGAHDVALGGGVYYGPPNGVHTFYIYIPPADYFEKHPEWFSLIDGKRTAEQAQLCLTNPDLRAAVMEKLRGYIEQSRAEAQQAGRAAPLDFDISQNDWGGMCQCEACQAIAKREGSESGPLIDFLNHVADAVRDKYPEVRINTLAYQMTEDPPKTLRPRDNVLPRLCDTNANLLRPITHADNQKFAERLATWGQVAKQLRIWDYAVTYTPHPGLPLPTVHTYAPDYRYFAEHNVEGVFTEHEHAILADLRDLKIWMMIKLLEDPYRYRLLVITKGDLHHQERKVQGSGIAHYFEAIEVVSEKDPETYARVAARHRIEPGRLMMVGNSVRSDVAPVVAIGGFGVHIPYKFTWAHEIMPDDHMQTYDIGDDAATDVAPTPSRPQRFWKLSSIHDLPDLIERIGSAA